MESIFEVTSTTKDEFLKLTPDSVSMGFAVFLKPETLGFDI